MALSDISLTAGMRSNLISLQGTVDLLNRTQERLSTGKKVNSALDNPVAYFAAQALNSRASDLSNLKDAMGQAIQTIKAADAGIKSITTLIESAKGLSQAARSQDTAGRADLAAQYDEIMTQIDNLALDSGYQGVNLLDSDTLTVQFNEGNTSTLDVIGFDGSAANLGANATATNSWATDEDIDADVEALNDAIAELRTQSATLSANLNIITTRQDFTTNMVNTLTGGADKLTLADMNEEGANMLMLQTRQALGTTALSLASQAAQSVLRLF
jgi:flagellin-like hook-associated protein FlgL